ITTLLTLLFTSCKADASAGLFRQLADAKEPVGIRYKQIIGVDVKNGPTYLYYLTEDGIYSKKDGSNPTLILEATKPILTASISGTTITYSTNKEPNAKSGIDIWQVETDGSGNTKMGDPALFDGFTLFEKYLQLPNGFFVVQGLKGATRSMSVVHYDGVVFTNYVTIDNLDGYELQDTLLLSGHEDEAISTQYPLLLSLLKGSSYTHYYIFDGVEDPIEIQLDKKLAGFWVFGDQYLYLLTEDGNLYGIDVQSAIPTLTHMKELARQYPAHAFVYGTQDVATTSLVTKSKSDNEALYLISFANNLIDNSGTINEKGISGGYAKHMSNVTIVSAFKNVNPGNLLIATYKNGMFEITITDAVAGTGTSTGPEDYKVSLL
ncbi:MAG: hypothetical protein RBS49_00315, partial [Sphaerochaeta sp.]|nr:hypothetical protein [Sphaerochaeta sp.]